jgi:hypothetical protein
MDKDIIILSDDSVEPGVTGSDLNKFVDTITLNSSIGSTGAVGATDYSYHTMATGGATTITLPSSTFAWNQNYNITGYTTAHGSVNITGDGIEMPSSSDIKIGDKSIKDAIEKIEERLAILHPNPKLEKKWGKLRDLRKAYMDLEAEIEEKEKMWEILKKS